MIFACFVGASAKVRLLLHKCNDEHLYVQYIHRQPQDVHGKERKKDVEQKMHQKQEKLKLRTTYELSIPLFSSASILLFKLLYKYYSKYDLYIFFCTHAKHELNSSLVNG